MTKQITQSNLYLLLPIKVSMIADLLLNESEITPIEAITKVYTSSTYKELEREESKAWCLGPTTLYYDLKQEDVNID